jgi:MOSC domain-containing protein YiiM
MTTQAGQVRALYFHPSAPGTPMRSTDAFELVEQMGIRGNARYFGRRSRSTGEPTVRQVSLMEAEQIQAHAQALDLEQIAPGAVRANIETAGIDLLGSVGCDLAIGEAILRICEPRTPCAKMDLICPGLRERMRQNRQGVLAQVVRSGQIRVGDPIRVLG